MVRVDEIAVVRIELQDIEPLIWRRVAVRTAMSLTNMHHVIQAAMGWLDSHVWEFQVSGVKYGPLSADDDEWNQLIEDASVTTLQSVLDAGVRQMQYVYDLGDYWEHSVIVEEVVPPQPGVRYPQFLGGERRCPPEDCGGPFGYAEFLREIASKRRDERSATLEWHGGPYDPDEVGEEKIVTALGAIANADAKR